MGNAVIILDLIFAAVTRVTELTALLQNAASEDRDVTDEEVAAARADAMAAVDKLEDQIRRTPLR